MDVSNASLASAAKQSALANFGCRIRDARHNIGLTQQEVAARLMVSTQTIRNWESGRYEPTRETIDALAALYQIPADTLRPGHTDVGTQAPPSGPNKRIDVDPGVLANARKQSGLSQDWAAQRAGISLATLRRYERGKARPTRSILRRLALLYGKPSTWPDPNSTDDAGLPEPPHMDHVLRTYLKVQPDLTNDSRSSISEFILFTHQRQMCRTQGPDACPQAQQVASFAHDHRDQLYLLPG